MRNKHPCDARWCVAVSDDGATIFQNQSFNSCDSNVVAIRTYQLRQAFSVKARLKKVVQKSPALWGRYQRLKVFVTRVFVLSYFLYDIRNTYRAMAWPSVQREKLRLSAELLFQYHKLEKGLVMPGPRRIFGIEPSRATIRLVERWIHCGFEKNDPVFLGAVETLEAYARHLEHYELDSGGSVARPVRALLHRVLERAPELATPQSLLASGSHVEVSVDAFRRLVVARRSVREFKQTPVAAQIIEDAISMAQQAPSACNRQPWSVYLLSDESMKSAVLHYQNGNRGFGHLAPHVAVITSDERCFFDASERHEPYIDGGLFAMTLALALRAHGVGTCCLNWCVPPANDRAVHRILDMPPERRIVMLMAIGYPVDECLVPKSPRRSMEEVLIYVH